MHGHLVHFQYLISYLNRLTLDNNVYPRKRSWRAWQRAVSRTIWIVSICVLLHFLELSEVLFVFSKTKMHFHNLRTNVIKNLYICVIKNWRTGYGQHWHFYFFLEYASCIVKHCSYRNLLWILFTSLLGFWELNICITGQFKAHP